MVKWFGYRDQLEATAVAFSSCFMVTDSIPTGVMGGEHYIDVKWRAQEVLQWYLKKVDEWILHSMAVSSVVFTKGTSLFSPIHMSLANQSKCPYFYVTKLYFLCLVRGLPSILNWTMITIGALSSLQRPTKQYQYIHIQRLKANFIHETDANWFTNMSHMTRLVKTWCNTTLPLRPLGDVVFWGRLLF